MARHGGGAARRRLALVAAGWAALFWAWVLLVSAADFDGRARSLLPAHGVALLLAVAAVLVAWRLGVRVTHAAVALGAGFAAMGLVAALVWYGYVLPEGCRDAVDRWEEKQGNASAALRPALSC